jgi:predicted acylesterase/phospholipase RssA
MEPESECVRKAREFFAGRSLTVEEQWELARELKKERRFGYARQVLGRLRRQIAGSDQDRGRLAARFGQKPDDTRQRVAQQEALCTSKDPDLPAATRHDRAIQILGGSDALETSTDQETLGIAGGILKRKWEFTANPQDLERSYECYHRGRLRGAANDDGYTGLNEAFVLDLRARAESNPAQTKGLRDQAREVRGEVLAALEAKVGQDASLLTKWWVRVTLAEALFGLGRHDEARQQLVEAMKIPGVDRWERDTTARQLTTLAYLQGAGEQAIAPVRVLLDGDPAALRSSLAGKVGLALSGGGFRASLFHLGVLACLAERDVLRHVEVLSCVSGGSIVGAQYYLRLRELLCRTGDAALGRDDYLKLLHDLIADFLAGVGKNIRPRVLSSPWANLRVAFTRYTFTERLARLLDEHFYGGAARRLDELTIQPPGNDPFHPGLDNWGRCHKVPVLVLNATTLRTGHNWQFTARYMGEPPYAIHAEVDGSDRLRRVYFGEKRRMSLAQAVAASAAVPGLFEPLRLQQRYEGETVALVDGGVHDNQGVTALLEQECTVVLVSDASGQLEAQPSTAGSRLSPLLRTKDILMERVRQSTYDRLHSRLGSGLLRGMIFLHLKRGLDVRAIDGDGSEEPRDESSDPEAPFQRLTPHGTPKDVQRRLAALRTDLDRFSDQEAYALMLCGYQMAGDSVRTELAALESLVADPRGPEGGWQFQAIEPLVNESDPSLLARLDEGRFRVLRSARARKWVPRLLAAAGLGLMAGLAWNVPRTWDAPTGLSWGHVWLAVIGLLLLGVDVVRGWTWKLVGFGGGGILASLLGWLWAWTEIGIVGPLRRWRGRLPQGASGSGIALPKPSPSAARRPRSST